jgi:hypothetical protein
VVPEQVKDPVQGPGSDLDRDAGWVLALEKAVGVSQSWRPPFLLKRQPFHEVPPIGKPTGPAEVEPDHDHISCDMNKVDLGWFLPGDEQRILRYVLCGVHAAGGLR